MGLVCARCVGWRACGVWVCCNAALTCRGLVQGTAWDPAANSLYANMQPSQELRDVLERQVHVNVVGERPSAAFIATGEDVATRAEGNVTQYSGGGKLLKEPRVIESTVYLGDALQ